MASAGSARPGRLLALTALVIVAIYAGIVLAGHLTPALGLDLRGGTSVTLTPRVQGGGKVTSSALSKAVDIIRQRVNGLGVAESDVTTEGNNIVISVPGKGRDQVVQLVGQTAQLRFRQVLAEAPVTPAAPASPSPAPSTSPSAHPSGVPSSGPSAKGRAVSDALRNTAGTAGTAGALPAATPAPTPPSTGGSTTGSAGAPAPSSAQQAEFAALQCTPKEQEELRAQNADVASDVLACDRDGTTKYLLGPADVQGTEVKSADAGLDQNGTGWQVNLSFKSKGTREFGDLTQRVVNLPSPTNQVAIVLDGVVQSAPQIINPILGGQAQITGNFTQKQATDLANVLKYGALPLTFDQSEVTSISPTLGSDQLRGGLIAGAIGLALVVLYCLLYYRGLGVVAVTSLGIAAVVTYGAVCALSASIGFTLTLAGIAGLIVAIGITADSFVVFFERLRDELREGRTLRSAVDKGWERARHTILTADLVSLSAAVILYLLSIGSVRGFAFTLGLSTLIDIGVVFCFTHPMVALLARTRWFGNGQAWTGLSPKRLGARKRAPEPQPRARRTTVSREV